MLSWYAFIVYMHESYPEHSPLQTEQRKLTEQMDTMSHTEGYALLTENQQRLLEQSLYVQARSERPGPYQQYNLSRKHVLCWNCHYSVANLEEEKGLSAERDSTPEEFFTAAYRKGEDMAELKNFLESFAFPLVLQISATPNGGLYNIWRSCLVLGHGKNRELVVWEKKNPEEPYRVTSLEEVYNYYKDYGDVYWGARKLAAKRE